MVTKRQQSSRNHHEKQPMRTQIPCHRVIKSDGNIGNFRGGEKGAVEEKIGMLLREGVSVIDRKIDLNEYRHEFK